MLSCYRNCSSFNNSSSFSLYIILISLSFNSWDLFLQILLALKIYLEKSAVPTPTFCCTQGSSFFHLVDFLYFSSEAFLLELSYTFYVWMFYLLHLRCVEIFNSVFVFVVFYKCFLWDMDVSLRAGFFCDFIQAHVFAMQLGLFSFICAYNMTVDLCHGVPHIQQLLDMHAAN